MIGTALKAALLGGALAAAAPGSGIELVPGRPATVDLGPAGTRDAAVELRRGESAEIAVLQQGIDVVVEVRSPAGTLLHTVDSPNGRQGDEPVSLFAGEGGRYRIHVRPISASEPAGQIVFRIVALRDRAETRALLAERRRAREEIGRAHV